MGNLLHHAFAGMVAPSHILAVIVLAVCAFQLSRSAILRVGNPLAWQASKPFLNQVRLGGVAQFQSHYTRCKGVEMPLFLWGDEIEYGIFKFDEEMRAFDLSLSAGTPTRLLLAELERLCPELPIGCEWQPEYGSWMVEAVPRDPFGSSLSDLMNVEKSMQLRRKRLHRALSPGEIAPSLSTFPMMGVAGYPHTSAHAQKHRDPNDHSSVTSGIADGVDSREGGNPISASLYIGDSSINPHPRFGALTQNIRMRRGDNVNILVPKDSAFPDQGASEGLCLGSEMVADASYPAEQYIHMDAMAFGMGCCCLQVTMQAKNERESRFLHDQLAILSPLLLALSASTPIFKGELAATDTRWDVISQAVDDRTPVERGQKPNSDGGDSSLVGGGVKLLSQSRYSESALFFAQPQDEAQSLALDALNDVPVEMDEEAYKMLTEGAVDPVLARHVAHLFTRDPLVIFDDAIALDNDATTDHFESLQSTNWRSMRWKPPSLSVGLEHQSQQAGSEGAVFATDLQSHGPGWRVEFRPLEVQLTDFENAAYAVAVVLLSRCLLVEGHNFYMPMSKLRENTRRAHLKDAVSTQKFWIRRNALNDAVSSRAGYSPCSSDQPVIVGDGEDRTGAAGAELLDIPSLEDVDLVELSLDEIMNGGPQFPGLLPQLLQFVSASSCDDTQAVTRTISPYLRLLGDRASGALPTAARWIRDFVSAEAAKSGDVGGALTPAVADSLLQLCEDVGMGRVQRPDLYGTRYPEDDSRSVVVVVPQLDTLDEEDLMFSNISCFIKPIAGPMQFFGRDFASNSTSNSANKSAALSTAALLAGSNTTVSNPAEENILYV